MSTTGADPAPERDPSGDARSRRAFVVGMLRALASTAAILVAYFLLPLDRLSDLSAYLALPLALAAFTLMLVYQFRAITRSALPGVRAVEALAISVPMLIVIFAATYYVMGSQSPDWFTESMSRLDSLYFTVTVFATVGFGDIAATSPEARGAVTIQMVVDLLVIGIGLRVILGAVKVARQRSGRPDPGLDQ